jgi:lysophospholipase L1-like esterase
MSNSTILIGDSITAGTSTSLANDTQRCGYVLSTIASSLVVDLSNAGQMICRRKGFQKNFFLSGLRDKGMVVRDTAADSVIVMMGANDLFNGTNIPTVIRETEYFADFIMQNAFLPKTVIIVSHVSTTDESTARQYCPAYRAAQLALVNKLHLKFTEGKYHSDCKFIDGTQISDCNNAAFMDDGVHRSPAGHADMAANMYTKLKLLGVMV